MISITTVIQTHLQMQKAQANTGVCKYRYENRRTLSFHVRMVFLTSVFSSSTRGERQNFYYANHLQRAAHFVISKISISRNPKKQQLHLQQPNLNSQLTLKSSGPSLPSMTSSILQPISCLGFIMTMVIVISFVRERKTVPNDYAWELLTRIVQNPTKLNDKI